MDGANIENLSIDPLHEGNTVRVNLLYAVGLVLVFKYPFMLIV